MLIGVSACKNVGDGKVTNATTLMIYMVGSDLEAKGGSGTSDLEEILKSQVDISKNNILIYAGGTKKWHNDTLAEVSGHSIIKLTNDGFDILDSRDEVSMGESETLSYFLNYACDNYKTTDYALILWDHGNGPLIGYGKDMLHDNDSLTLTEMSDALKASPFSEENKLAWVGFDACLMSSVELACVWEDYADYLIASQEIEPSFGWNYSFLKNLGKYDIKQLAGEITNLYMDSCFEYYERKNFDQRDTTLACLDLSVIDPLRNSLEELFSAAKQNVATEYSELVATRVNTRALGRASTGSEYDLIDLVDLAEQMKARYPNEAEAVISAAKDLVVHNVTNAQGCCGLSIYYPFYNKSYYEKTWKDTYRQLDVPKSYIEYLDAYAQLWLKNDLLQSVASSVKPQALSNKEFVLSLTEEQSTNYADANYYILQREGNGIYKRIFTSSNIAKKGNKLTANFDGNILYAKNKFDQYWIPAVDEHDTVGDYTRFSTYLNLINDTPVYGYEPYEGYEHQVAGHRFHISVNNLTNEVKTSALVPYNHEIQTKDLIGGKQDDADLSMWSQYFFIEERHLYLQRDANGTIMPLEKWQESDYYSANPSRVEDDLEFVLAPIPSGEYYLIFEILDVQGNKYCSELLPIQSEGVGLPSKYKAENYESTWESGEKVKLFSHDGITAYMTTEAQYDAVNYALYVENTNDFDVAVLCDHLMINDTIYCNDGSIGYFVVEAGGSITDKIDFGIATHLIESEQIKSVHFIYSLITATGSRTIAYNNGVSVSLSEYAISLRKNPPEDSWFIGADMYKNSEPACGLLAQKQQLFEQDGLNVTVLGFGGNGDDNNLILTFKFENKSSYNQNIRIDGISFDNVFANEATGPITIYAGTSMYYSMTLLESELDLYQIASASVVKIYISKMQFATLIGGGGFSEYSAYNVKLTNSGSIAEINHGNNVLYEDSSVKIFLKSAQEDKYGGYEWTCTMINKGSQDIMLMSTDRAVNGKSMENDLDILAATLLAPYDQRCPAGHSITFVVEYTGEDTSGELKATFKPQFYDMQGEQLLYEGTEIVLNK